MSNRPPALLVPPRTGSRLFTRSVLLLLLLLLPALSAAEDSLATGAPLLPSRVDGAWGSFGIYLGTDATVRKLIAYDGLLVATGDFLELGPINASRIAARSGATWERLGEGLNGAGRAMIVFEGDLVAGGDFTYAGGAPAKHVARWDGAGWSRFAFGLDGTVEAFASFGGELHAGGSFSRTGVQTVSPNIARWDGTAWRSIAIGMGTNGRIRALLPWNGTLVAAGDFTSAGGLAASKIAAWDGAAWADLGGGTNGAVYALVEWNGDLVAGGGFTEAGGAPAPRVARWDGAAWNGMGDPGGTVADLAILDGELYAAGTFSLRRWNGASWEPTGNGPAGSVETAIEFQRSLFAAGSFSIDGGAPADRIAEFDGAEWVPAAFLGGPGGLNGPASVIADYDGGVVVGGEFTFAGTLPVARVARYGAEAWDSVGHGFGQAPTAIVPRGDGLVASAGTGALAQAFRYDGGPWWWPLGEHFNDAAYAFLEDGGELYAGGAFRYSGTTPMKRMARFDTLTSQWTADASFDSTVRAMILFEGDRVAAGDFLNVDGVAVSRVARRSGGVWSALGDGFNGTVHDLRIHDGALVAAGEFTASGGTSLNRVARWNGASWDSIGPTIYRTCWTLTEYNGDLVAGGEFHDWGHLARWDGETWSTFGDGLDGYAYDAHPIDVNGSPGLLVSGAFTRAGDLASHGIALWVDDLATWEPADRIPELVPGLALGPNAPNPFNPSTTISFEVPRAGRVRLTVHDVTGRLVATLVDGRREAGAHTVLWDGRNARGDDAASGVYLLRLDGAEGAATRKIQLVR